MFSNTLQLFIITALFHVNVDLANAFVQPMPSTTFAMRVEERNLQTITSSVKNVSHHSKSRLSAVTDEQNSDEEVTTVGSSEYYQGFLNRPVDQEPTERVTGDAVLGPTLKLAGGVTFILVALTTAFLASNGII
eukprot:768732_1